MYKKALLFTVVTLLLLAGTSSVFADPPDPVHPLATPVIDGHPQDGAAGGAYHVMAPTPPGPKSLPTWLAPGVKYPVAVEEPILPTPAYAPQHSPLALLNIWLYVPRFSQNDPNWKGDVMQTCGMTIGQAGCALTSASMVFKYYGAINKNPGQLNTCMGDKACPFWWRDGAEHCSEGKATYVGYYNFDYGTLVWALDSGRPPILELTKSGNTHWVVVNAVHGDGLSPDNYRINDPWDGVNKNLASYTNNGWSLSNIVVYSKQ